MQLDALAARSAACTAIDLSAVEVLLGRNPMALRVVIFVPPIVTALDVAGPLEVFRMAGDSLGQSYQIEVCALTKSVPVVGNLQFGNLLTCDQVKIGAEDILVVAGFPGAPMPTVRLLRKQPAFFEWIRRAHRAGATVCSTCTGAFLLAEAGILDGRDCVTHWADVDELQTNYPLTRVRKCILFAQSGNVFTSAGVASGIDMSIHLIALRHGPKLAFEVARRMVIYLRRGGDTDQESVYLKYRNHLDDMVHRAQSLLIEELDAPPSLEHLAARVGSSPRNLSRRFRQSLGLSMGAYLKELRLERARSMLQEHGSKVEDVARACGFNGGRQLRNLYQAHFGHSPRARNGSLNN